MTNILQEIAAYKREFVARRRRERPLAQVRSAAQEAPGPRSFERAVRNGGITLIAEIKKASPSRGVIRADFDVESIARTYAAHGAGALSVVTDEAYFQGCDVNLQRARRVTDLPVLRKDFTVDEYQVYEARALGADAVLLITALLDGGRLKDLHDLSAGLGMTALVEVHAAGELDRALAAGARVIGINNRDLRTFTTSLDTTVDLRPSIPPQVTVISESGIHTRDHVMRLEEAGVHGILVGEALMREPDPGVKVRELLGRQEPS